MAGDSINGYTLKLPSSPFYQQPYTRTGVVCDRSTLDNGEGSSCTHVEKLPANVSIYCRLI